MVALARATPLILWLLTSTFTVTTTAAASSHCDAVVAELQRRQDVEFPSSGGEAFDGDANLKHKPFLQIESKVAVITVSPRSVTGDAADPLHPMTDSIDPDAIHYIDTLFALDQNGAVASLRRLSSREAAPARFSFEIPEGVTSLTPYEHCNKHGLFAGDKVVVTPAQTTAGVERCALEVCSAVVPGDCESSDVELRRQHAVAFNTSAPFSGDVSVKHKPYLTISGTTATVVVGLGALPGQDGQPVHPMVASGNPSEVHWVDHIWVKNQDGDVVAMRDLDATETSPATLTFEVPEGTTELIAYEHCNLHGLFEGDAVAVTPSQTRAGQSSTCDARFCTARADEVAEAPAPDSPQSDDGFPVLFVVVALAASCFCFVVSGDALLRYQSAPRADDSEVRRSVPVEPKRAGPAEPHDLEEGLPTPQRGLPAAMPAI